MNLIPDILFLRDYAAAKSVYDNAENANKLPDDPMIKLAKQIDFEHEFSIARVAEELEIEEAKAAAEADGDDDK